MKLFELEGRNVIIAPEILSIAVFKKLLDRDKSKNKNKAFQEFAYIYWFCDYKPNFAGLPDNERHPLAVKEAGLPDNWTPDNDVKVAIAKYLERRDTDLVLLVKSAKGVVTKVRQYYDGLDFKEVDDKGKLVNNPQHVLASVAGLGKTVSSLDELEKKIKVQDYEVTNKQRGGGRKGAFEDPEDDED
jgi:hypothetical protein